jgi:hypothetical protein
MSRKWKIAIALILLAVILTSILFGQVKTKKFSAYATCRNVAMNTKGYAVWQHQSTSNRVFVSWVTFSDGFNDLTCQAVGLGPFWIPVTTMQTLVGCATSLSANPTSACPEDYFGVSP